MKREKNTPLKVVMPGHETVPAMDGSCGGVEVVVEEFTPRLFGRKCVCTVYGIAGISNTSKNLFIYGNDARRGHGYRFGTGGLVGLSWGGIDI